MTSQPPSRPIRLAVSQSHTLATLASTLSALQSTTRRAAAAGVDLLLFPEAYLGGYPRGATFGTRIGARDAGGKEQFLRYWRGAVDLGGDGGDGSVSGSDGASGGGGGGGGGGDGTREFLEEVARETDVFVVVGLVERAGGTMYCSVVYVCPKLGVIGKRRKVMPTGAERLVWGQGQPSSLRAVTTTIRGVKITLAAAICWENYMPLLRQSLYCQNVNLYLAPTADARDTWLALMRTVACEGRCFVLSSNQCIREKDLPDWIGHKTVEQDSSQDEDRIERLYRRRSVVTETGNEIALPAKRKEVPEEALLDDEEEEHGPLHHRKSSLITEHGHEIIFPAVGENDRQRTDSRGEDDTNGLTRPRKESCITEDGHEIALPSGGFKYDTAGALSGDHEATNGAAARKRQSYITEEGHEIVCPAVAKSKLNPTVNGHGLKNTKAPESKTESLNASPFACRGGSCIIAPNGDVLAGPVWEIEDEIIVVDVDFDDCIRGRLDLDVAGSYSRSDAFKLTVEGLDLSPPL